jgi:hypothetical protein
LAASASPMQREERTGQCIAEPTNRGGCRGPAAVNPAFNNQQVMPFGGGCDDVALRVGNPGASPFNLLTISPQDMLFLAQISCAAACVSTRYSA